MTRKRWLAVSVGLIIWLAVTDIVLWVRLSQSRAINAQWLSDLQELGSQAYTYETYIVKSFRYAGLPARTIYDALSSQDETIARKDSVLVILLPQETCGACANALFERLDAENYPGNDLYLIAERPHSVLEREWRAHGFGPIATGTSDIFEHLDLHSEILLLKISKQTPIAQPMICEPAYMRFLSVFLHS